MQSNYQPLFSEAYLWSVWQRDFQGYVDNHDKDLLKTLTNWSEKESLFIYAQWKQKIRGINVTEKYNAKSLVTDLLDLVKTENSAVKDQVTALDKEIDALEKKISVKEKEMNEVVYKLYKLTDEEILLVERG
ncbi:MAG TPA: hypothetical protein PL163_21815 [Leptospiraceae bacterium]|nr:hypothetical protein [Leptospiraceae bacterium]